VKLFAAIHLDDIAVILWADMRLSNDQLELRDKAHLKFLPAMQAHRQMCP
jgi:hypothetical protein